MPNRPQPRAISSDMLLAGSPLATFALDMEHRLIHFNPACELLLGVKADDVFDTRSLSRHLYGYERPLLADLLVNGMPTSELETLYDGGDTLATMISGAVQSDEHFPMLGPNGRWLSFVAAPLFDETGAIIGAVETIQDISEHQRVEQELRAAELALSKKLSFAEQQLVQSEKLSSIGQLAAGVAHEINNPIGYVFSNFGTLERYLISLFSMLDAYERAEPELTDGHTRASLMALRRDIELDYLKQDVPALMRESKEGISRVRKIVQDLKDFSHVDATLDWQFIDLTSCIDSTVNVAHNQIKYQAQLVREYMPTPEIQCHASELNQVIMNLVVNAAQAIDGPGGIVTIKTGTEGDKVWFEVSDNGAGIDTKTMGRIFDPFFTTKPIGQGTGLGLSISYGIVRKHHGEFKVRSELGKGSSFRVILPRVQPESSLAAEFENP